MNDVKGTLRIMSEKNNESVKSTKDGETIEETKTVTLKGEILQGLQVSVTLSGYSHDVDDYLGSIILKSEVLVSMTKANESLEKFDEEKKKEGKKKKKK